MGPDSVDGVASEETGRVCPIRAGSTADVLPGVVAEVRIPAPCAARICLAVIPVV